MAKSVGKKFSADISPYSAGNFAGKSRDSSNENPTPRKRKLKVRVAYPDKGGLHTPKIYSIFVASKRRIEVVKMGKTYLDKNNF